MFFFYLDENPLQSITTWHREPMDMTKCWHSSFDMLYHAFIALAFSSCLFKVFLPSVLSSFGSNLLYWVEIMWVPCLTYLMKNIPFFCLEKLLDCFCCMFWIIINLQYKAESISVLQHLAESEQRVYPNHFKIHPANFVSNQVIIGSCTCHAITLDPPYLTNDVVCFRS